MGLERLCVDGTGNPSTAADGGVEAAVEVEGVLGAGPATGP